MLVAVARFSHSARSWAPLLVPMLLLPVHGATAGCLDGCVRDGAAPIRVRFVTHGRQSDSFWQAMRDNVINSAAVFGAAFDPAADWVWYESDPCSSFTRGSGGLLASWLNTDWLDLWSRSPAGGAASWAVACWLGSRRSSRMLLVLLAVIRGAHAQKVSEVRIGGLFPLVDTSVNKVGRLAAFVMAVQEINNSPDLLPNVNLR